MDLTMGELQEMAIRQQQQIDMNNQIIRNREERLRQLLDQQRYQIENLCGTVNNQCKISSSKDTSRLAALRKSVMEYRQTTSQDTASDLDIIRLLCSEKEDQIKSVQNRIDDLNRQIDHLRQVKQQLSSNDRDRRVDHSKDCFNELDEERTIDGDVQLQSTCDVDRIRQELLIRNRLNDQQAKKIASTKDLHAKKQNELLAIEHRLSELTERLCSQNFVRPKFTDLSACLNSPSADDLGSYDFVGSANTTQEANESNRLLTSVHSSPLPLNGTAERPLAVQQRLTNCSTERPFHSTDIVGCDNSDISSLSGVLNLRPDDDKLNMHPNVMNAIKKRHSITDSSAAESSCYSTHPSLNQTHHQHYPHYVQVPISQLRARIETAASPTNGQIRRNQPATNLDDTASAQTTIPVLKLTNHVDVVDRKQSIVANDNGNTTSSTSSDAACLTNNDKMITRTDTARGRCKRVRFDPLAILLDAAVEGELDLVIEANRQLQNPSQPNDEGITALHNAVCAGNFHCVEYLVQSGCDINYADNDGWTPLHCAASCNNLMIIRFLIEHGASIFARTGNDGEMPEDKCEIDEDGYDECFDYLTTIKEELGEINEGQVYVLYSYNPENSDEMKLHINQQLRIVRRGDDNEHEWWWAEDCSSTQTGYVPRNFLALYPRVIKDAIN